MGNISSFQSSTRADKAPVPPPAEQAAPGLDKKAATARLLEQLSQGALGPISKLQDALELTVEQIADWMAQPRNRHVVANLVTLFDAQTQLMVCQHRLIAVARLAEVAATAESPETVRRACKDLLAVRLIDPYLEDVRPEKPAPPAEVDTEAILEALEKLGDADSLKPGEPPRPEPVRDREDWSGRASARASFTDERDRKGLSFQEKDSVPGRGANDVSLDGAPRRAQTNAPGCARGSCRGPSTGRPGADSRVDLNVRAPPRAKVRRY